MAKTCTSSEYSLSLLRSLYHRDFVSSFALVNAKTQEKNIRHRSGFDLALQLA